jgi:3-hydroxybutyryl-CoA dehydratase
MKIGRTIDEFKLGMKAEFSHTFTQQETETMAELIGDHNPFHYDSEFIRKTRFKRPIVHGLLVGGMISHFGGDLFPGPGCLAEEIYFKFLKPVYFGDTIHAVAEVIKIEEEEGRLTFSMVCYNAQLEVVCEGEATGIPYQIEIS